MPFKKGQSGNPAGRRVGSKNKKTEQWKKFEEWMMSDGIERLQNEMQTLEAREFITTVRGLMEYFQPKLARTEHTGKDGEELQAPPVLVKFLNGKDDNDSK